MHARVAHSLRYAAELALVCGAYFGAAKGGLALASGTQQVSAVWPPTGLALAVVVLRGPRMWPAIAAGALLANATAAEPLGTALGITIGNTLEALVGAWLLALAGFRPSLERPRDVLALAVLAAAVSTLVSATIGVLSLRLGGLVSGDELASVWRVWWLGDLGGDLVVAPALLVLAPLAAAWSPRTGLPRVHRALGVGAVLAVLCVLVFSTHEPLPYLLLPVVFLVSLVFRQPGAVGATLLVSGFAVWFTARDQGPFVGGSPDANLLRAQLFVGVLALTALLVAAVRAELVQAEARLLSSETQRAAVGRSERLLAEAQQVAHIGSWEWDVKSDAVSWSDELFRILGLPPRAFSPTFADSLQRVHPDDRERVEAAVRQATLDHAPFDLEYRALRPDGEQRIVHARGTVAVDGRGQAARIYGAAQDITDRRRAEDDLRRSDEGFRLLVDGVTDYAIFMLGVDGPIVSWNAGAERITGYRGEEVISRHFSLFYTPEDVAAGHPERELELAAADGRYAEEGWRVRKDGTRFWASVVITALRHEDGRLRGFAKVTRDVTERKRAADELARHALHDALTELPNRHLFLYRLDLALARARNERTGIAVLFVDVDRFKLVNDSFGHAIGDQVLTEVARRLEVLIRPGDTLARLAGDEFVVVCPEVDSENAAITVAARLSGAFQEPFDVVGQETSLSASIGIALSRDSGTNPSVLLRNADAAMYRAKQRGRAGYALFESTMRVGGANRLALENELRRAVDQDELGLVYQPIVDLADGEIIGVEALLRWHHPERGLLTPGEFIPLAEESELIVSLGEWVLREATREAARWPGGRALRPPFLTVNLAARQLSDPAFCERLQQFLDDAGLEPTALMLEITERTIMHDADETARTLRGLKRLGVRIAIDDFGIGFSWLGEIRRLPGVDTLKIDRTFTAELGRPTEDEPIVAAILGIARALDMTVIAEGIERSEQAERLRVLGCEQGQGLYFGGPGPPERIGELLATPVERELLA
jgi:diguanylate cyclase (GGDEF)-like protein/PAS domain S-box-containing protein